MQYLRLQVGKSRKNRVTDKESEGFAYLCTNLNDWGMSDIFNSSHFLRGTNEVLPDQPRKLGRSRNLLGEQEGKALHIANLLFLPFYLLREDGGVSRTDTETPGAQASCDGLGAPSYS